MTRVDPALAQSLGHALYLCLLVGLALSALWGLWLLLAPRTAARFAAAADRWVSLDRVSERLNRRISSYRVFYRNHRVAGALITIGAAYCLARWSLAYDRAALLSDFDPALQRAGLDWLVAAIEWSFVFFNVAILVAGLVVLIRPSLLKTAERYADRWVKLEAAPTLDRRYDPLGPTVSDHPRLAGAAILVCCSFLLWRLQML